MAHIESDNQLPACQRLASNPNNAQNAFKGHRKLTTTCPDYRLVIEIAFDNNVPLWSVCFLRFKTQKISSINIKVDDNSIHTVSPFIFTSKLHFQFHEVIDWGGEGGYRPLFDFCIRQRIRQHVIYHWK